MIFQDASDGHLASLQIIKYNVHRVSFLATKVDLF